MAVNCRFAFGVHLLSVLALSPDQTFSSEQLARTVNTNAVVIRRLLLELKGAGLVVTQRGPGGGTRLSSPADQITLARIYRCLAGTVDLGAHPKLPAQSCPVGREIRGVLDQIAARANAAVQREFEAVTLADVAAQIEAAAADPLEQPALAAR